MSSVPLMTASQHVIASQTKYTWISVKNRHRWERIASWYVQPRDNHTEPFKADGRGGSVDTKRWFEMIADGWRSLEMPLTPGSPECPFSLELATIVT